MGKKRSTPGGRVGNGGREEGERWQRFRTTARTGALSRRVVLLAPIFLRKRRGNRNGRGGVGSRDWSRLAQRVLCSNVRGEKSHGIKNAPDEGQGGGKRQTRTGEGSRWMAQKERRWSGKKRAGVGPGVWEGGDPGEDGEGGRSQPPPPPAPAEEQLAPATKTCMGLDTVF